jgi:hypothetical protein
MVERSEAPKLSTAAATRPSDDFHVAGVRAIRRGSRRADGPSHAEPTVRDRHDDAVPRKNG